MLSSVQWARELGLEREEVLVRSRLRMCIEGGVCGRAERSWEGRG